MHKNVDDTPRDTRIMLSITVESLLASTTAIFRFHTDNNIILKDSGRPPDSCLLGTRPTS